MHELSIAMSMIEMAAGELDKHAGAVRVSALYLKLGALSGVAREALLFSWEIACQGTPLENSRLEIEEVPVVVYCAACRAPKTLSSLTGFYCPDCRAPAAEIVQGKELQVTALEIV